MTTTYLYFLKKKKKKINYIKLSPSSIIKNNKNLWLVCDPEYRRHPLGDLMFKTFPKKEKKRRKKN